MRCEICGCVGVTREWLVRGRRERRRFWWLASLLIVPAIVYWMTVFRRPYCARCKRRVGGDGVSTRDATERPVVPIGTSKETEPDRVVTMMPRALANGQADSNFVGNTVLFRADKEKQPHAV